ncbi:MAG: OmpA family protein [Flavobacteriales bacterium]|nr:OmpA family protein [Flavobacteriales bacterium]
MMAKKLALFTMGIMLTSLSFSQQDTISFSPAQKLDQEINSFAEEGLPILASDLTTLYFARTFHPENAGGDFSGQDIWKSELKDGRYSKAEAVAGLNDEWSNAVIGVAQNGRRLYLMNQLNDEDMPISGISFADYNPTEKKWSDPVAVDVPGLEVNGTFYSAFVSSDESFILWTIPTTEDDTTSNDLYVCEKKGDGWGVPMSLGSSINTSLNEISPFFDSVTELLFYSTNGKGSQNDYDIYYSKRIDNDWSNWAEPIRASFNSPEFDAYFFMGSDSSAYFSSNRNDSLSNLYLTQVRIEPIMDEVAEEIAEEPDSLLAVVEKNTKKRDPVLIVELDGSENKNKSLDDLTREELLSDNTIIRFVYFEYDKFNISAKYVEVLDDVAEILDNNPDINVTINGHTDAVASEPYNQILSENRAASTKEWLVINGVDPDRITTVGFGERDPYASNMTNEGRSLNRRVEIFFDKK